MPYVPSSSFSAPRKADWKSFSSLEQLLDKVCDDLGIGLASELVAVGFELGAEGGIVLDDAVMHNGDRAVAIRMRMRVLNGRSAVRRPARMGDSAPAGLKTGIQLRRLGAGDAADLAENLEAVAARHRHAPGIVSAIFEPFQAFEEQAGARARSDVAENSAHGNNAA